MFRGIWNPGALSRSKLETRPSDLYWAGKRRTGLINHKHFIRREIIPCCIWYFLGYILSISTLKIPNGIFTSGPNLLKECVFMRRVSLIRIKYILALA